MPGSVSAAPNSDRQRGQQHDVADQHEVRDQAEGAVVDRHEHEQQRRADQQRAHALVDVVLAEARADQPLLDDEHRRRQRAGAQQLGELLALAAGEAGDLELVGEHAADGRDVDDVLARHVDRDLLAALVAQLALALDEHHRHRLAEVLAGRAQHLLAAARIEADADRRLALLEGRGRVGELLAGDDDLALQQHRVAAAVLVELGAERRVAGLLRLEGVAGLVDQPELERRGLAEQADDLARVLHARQLHRDAVGALALHARLGHAERVDAVAEGGDVLLHREVLALAHLGVGQRGADRRLARDQRHVGIDRGERGARVFELGGVLERHRDAAGVALDRLVLDALLAQCEPVVALEPLQRLLDRAADVDLVDEVDAAAQVEAEVHGLEAHRPRPGRRARGESGRDRVGARLRGVDQVARLQLRRHVGEAQHHAPVLHERGVDRHLLARQEVEERLRGGGALEQLAVLARQLQRRRLAEHVRQRKDEREQHHEREQQALPEGISVHAGRCSVSGALRRS